MAEITQIDLGLVVGDTGATGATGPTGPQGPGATISVGSVTTTTYGNPAQVTNSGTATDAVLDFVIPQGAPGEEVTDVSSLTLNSITETAASFPVPAVGDVMSVVMGKVKKFFADTVAALNTKLNKSNVVNDLTYTTEGYALDARAGKTLKTQIDSLNDSLSNMIVWHGATALTPYKNTSANTWENTGNTFTVPNGHLYLISLSTGWSSGQPTGLGVNKGTSLTGNTPDVAYESTTALRTPMIVCNSGTWNIFSKRASAGTGTNNYYIEYLDITL